MFGALDDEGPASRDGLLAGRLVTYPLVHAVPVRALASAGIEVLATFRRPHFTIRLRTVGLCLNGGMLAGEAYQRRKRLSVAR